MGLEADAADARARRDRRADAAFRALLWLAGLLVLFTLGGTAASLAWGGREAFATFGPGFLVGVDWDPAGRIFGALVPVYGTLVTSLLAMLLAVPVSFGIALFLTEIAPGWLRTPVAAAIELLAAIPSIIYGMWGLFVFVPFMAEHVEPWLIDHLGPLPVFGVLFRGAPLGIGMLTGGVILGIMVIPFVSSVMHEVFSVVPAMLKESAYALGCTTWEVVRDIVLPYTRSAVSGGIFLGMGRALGETMAVTFVLGNTHNLSLSLVDPGNSIAAAIANEFAEADSGLYLSSLIALGLVLFAVTFLVLAAAKLLLLRLERTAGR